MAKGMRKIPTGIETLDLATGGGLPVGSMILLHGDVGTGKSEFAYTVVANCSAMMSDPLLQPEGKDIFIPENIWFAAISRSKEGVLRDVKGKFSDEFYERFSRAVMFKEFLPIYHRPTKFPDWVLGMRGENALKLREEMLAPITKFLEREAPHNIVILYTLTDIARIFRRGEETDLISFVQSTQEMCREWNVLVLSVFSAGILDEDVEKSLISSADGVLSFTMEGGGTMRNVLYCKKLRGATASLREPFEIEITRSGLELKRMRTIGES